MGDDKKPKQLSTSTDWNDLERQIGPRLAGMLRHKLEAPIRRRLREEELEHEQKLASIRRTRSVDKRTEHVRKYKLEAKKLGKKQSLYVAIEMDKAIDRHQVPSEKELLSVLKTWEEVSGDSSWEGNARHQKTRGAVAAWITRA